jgi:hypothetical protein
LLAFGHFLLAVFAVWKAMFFFGSRVEPIFEPRPLSIRRRSLIYFIRFGTHRLVKIGYSKDHPWKRMATMQTGTPERLHLLGMAPGSPEDEAAWHKRFAHLRVRGEWFKWTPELRQAAKSHLHDPFSRKARKLAIDNGLDPLPEFGTKAWRARLNAVRV